MAIAATVPLPALAQAPDDDDDFRTNPKVGQLVMSAELCREQQLRATTLAAISKEKKYSRIGGVVNLKRMAELQDDVREADDRIAIEKGRLKDRKLASMACSSPGVRGLLKCDFQSENGAPAGDCDHPLISKLLALLSAEHEWGLKDE